MPWAASGGSIPPLVAVPVAFILLVMLHVAFSRLSRSRSGKEVMPMIGNLNTGVCSVLETIWAAGTGYLVGALPT